MSGKEASCYFLIAAQTCIDRYLAPQIKMRLRVADVKPNGHHCPYRAFHVFMHVGFVRVVLQVHPRKHFSMKEALKLPSLEEKKPLSIMST